MFYSVYITYQVVLVLVFKLHTSDLIPAGFLTYQVVNRRIFNEFQGFCLQELVELYACENEDGTISIVGFFEDQNFLVFDAIII